MPDKVLLVELMFPLQLPYDISEGAVRGAGDCGRCHFRVRRDSNLKKQGKALYDGELGMFSFCKLFALAVPLLYDLSLCFVRGFLG